MSFQHGAGNDSEKRSLLRRELVIVALGGFAMFALAHLLSHQLASSFTGYDADLMAFTERAFSIYSFSLLFFGFTMLGSSVFTALGNGTASAMLAFVHTAVFEVGSVLALPRVFGPDAIWASIVVAEIAATLLTIALFSKIGPRYGLCPIRK